ncbi:MAG: HAD family phosphatase [Candidatus Woesearchaeota archaeon]
MVVGLIGLDLEGTLCYELTNWIADSIGKGEEVKSITNAGMNAGLPFRESLRKRLMIFREAGITNEDVVRAANEVPLFKDVCKLIEKLKEYDFKIAVITGGPRIAAEIVTKRLGGVDYIVANEWEFKEGRLTGGFEIKVVEKAEILKGLAAHFGATEIWAIGDGSNDVRMINEADYGFAFRPKPFVAKQTTRHIQEHMEVIKYLEVNFGQDF